MINNKYNYSYFIEISEAILLGAKEMSSRSVIYETCLEIINLIYINKKDLTLNDLQCLIYNKIN